ncbi:B-cell receptor CD22-like [Oreochromis aureus]|uniref:Ig-like domain-containing protein n=1 Tax=Oreochromis aureus TaxID=47969 RepID=A0AAZ1XJ22_OREAU|nr:B-cell receptor CD22-like [Oreochromis aureus]
MLLAEAGCLFLGFILCLSGGQGKPNSICALKGSSVNLPCSHQHPTARNSWYTGHWTVSKIMFSADETHVKYSMSAESNFTLTINNLTERDANFYCCIKTADTSKCQQSGIHLQVTELQVKVIPATQGQTVTLMCSSSCPLTEKPAAYIWYKNREFLYEDWSPWYQELLSSEEAVTYSCAVKGYEDLRAPEVSVDSITQTCFSVTYAKGRMCSSQQTSVDESCSITYPREIHVQRTPAEHKDHIRLTCNSSCFLTDPLISFVWYENRKPTLKEGKQIQVPRSQTDSLSCAVKGLEDVRSADVCVNGSCWSLNYVHSRICALEGSSVNISCKYSHPDYEQIQSKCWYKVKREAEQLTEDADHVEYDDSMKNQHILRLKKLKRDDSAEYRFTITAENEEVKQSDFPGVTLIVTELRVKMSPSAVVTEGQRVTLTCSTSCPLTDNTNYIWYLNSRPLTPRENQNKHLILDPVSREDAGSYSCAVKTNKDISSAPKTLTVQSITGTWTPAAAGVSAALLLLILLTVFCLIRKKRPCSNCSGNEIMENSTYESFSAPLPEEEPNYSEICLSKNKTETIYSTVQPFQPQEQDHHPYNVVDLRNKTAPKLNDQAVDT